MVALFFCKSFGFWKKDVSNFKHIFNMADPIWRIKHTFFVFILNRYLKFSAIVDRGSIVMAFPNLMHKNIIQSEKVFLIKVKRGVN